MAIICWIQGINAQWGGKERRSCKSGIGISIKTNDWTFQVVWKKWYNLIQSMFIYIDIRKKEKTRFLKMIPSLTGIRKKEVNLPPRCLWQKVFFQFALSLLIYCRKTSETSFSLFLMNWAFTVNIFKGTSFECCSNFFSTVYWQILINLLDYLKPLWLHNFSLPCFESRSETKEKKKYIFELFWMECQNWVSCVTHPKKTSCWYTGCAALKIPGARSTLN